MRNENIYNMIKNLKNHIVTTKPEYNEKRNKTKTLFLRDFLLYAVLRDKKNIHNCAHNIELAKSELESLIKHLDSYINSYDKNIDNEKKDYYYLKNKAHYDTLIGIHSREDLVEVLDLLKKSLIQIGEIK